MLSKKMNASNPDNSTALNIKQVNSLSFTSRLNNNKDTGASFPSNRIETSLKAAVNNLQLDKAAVTLTKAKEIERIQQSMQIRLSNLKNKDKSANTTAEMESQHSCQNDPNSEYNVVELHDRLEEAQNMKEVKDEYNNTTTRKFFRIEDEKSSKSINHQSNIIRPLLEVIEEVNHEDHKFGAVDDADDNSIDEGCIDVFHHRTMRGKQGRSLTKELPTSRAKLNKFLSSQKNSKVQVVEVYLGNDLKNKVQGTQSEKNLTPRDYLSRDNNKNEESSTSL